MPVKHANAVVEQILQTIVKIRQKASNGLIAHGITSAQVYINPGAEHVDSYQEARVN